MTVWQTIITIVRGLANDVSEKITDALALNQLEANTYAARKHLEEGQQYLHSLVKTQHRLQRNMLDLTHKIARLETRAQLAIQEKNQVKAYAIAEHIAQLEQTRSNQDSQHRQQQQQIRELTLNTYQTEQNIKTLRRESLALRATASIQKAHMTSMTSTVFSSRESLQRIRIRQQQRKDYLQAQTQLQHPNQTQRTLEEEGRVEVLEVLLDHVDYTETLFDKVEKTHGQAMHEALHRILDKK